MSLGECSVCGHPASLHWASQELGRDECMDECHAEGCSCGNYEGPKDIDSAGETYANDDLSTQ